MTKLELDLIRTALRTELEARGHEVGSDTTGRSTDLFVVGHGDRARALFEVKASADDALGMYQGHWPDNLPARVAVVPDVEEDSWILDTLCQAGMLVLRYREQQTSLDFPDLDSLLAQIV